MKAVKLTKKQMDQDSPKKMSKTCKTKVFSIKHKIIGWTDSHMELRYTFAVRNTDSSTWTDRPSKTVVKEFYITTMNGVIGTVGGTLGLFVGLSFLGVGTWLLDSLTYIISVIKRGHHHKGIKARV